MENSEANKGKIFTFKHYILLLIWWLSLGFTLDTNSAILGLVLSFLFFILTAMKVIQKSILIMLAVFVLTAIFPPLGLVVGILVSVIQAATQIQEMTLTFIPKLLSMFLALLFAMPWLMDKMMTYTRSVFINIPTYLR